MKPRASEYEQGLGHDGIMLEASLYYWLLLSAALVLAASVSRAEDDPHRVYRVGFVAAQSPSTVPNGVSAFRDRLRELGYVQGQNLVIEARWAGELKVIAPARGLKLRVIDVREPAALDRASPRRRVPLRASWYFQTPSWRHIANESPYSRRSTAFRRCTTFATSSMQVV